jgi:hypothetical protein
MRAATSAAVASFRETMSTWRVQCGETEEGWRGRHLEDLVDEGPVSDGGLVDLAEKSGGLLAEHVLEARANVVSDDAGEDRGEQIVEPGEARVLDLDRQRLHRNEAARQHQHGLPAGHILRRKEVRQAQERAAYGPPEVGIDLRFLLSIGGRGWTRGVLWSE